MVTPSSERRDWAARTRVTNPSSERRVFAQIRVGEREGAEERRGSCSSENRGAGERGLESFTETRNTVILAF